MPAHCIGTSAKISRCMRMTFVYACGGLNPDGDRFGGFLPLRATSSTSAASIAGTVSPSAAAVLVRFGTQNIRRSAIAAGISQGQ